VVWRGGGGGEGVVELNSIDLYIAVTTGKGVGNDLKLSF
jgi:hypothetical protein